MNAYYEAALRLLYPASCAICSQFLTLEENGACATCRKRLNQLRFSLQDAMVDSSTNSLDDIWSLYPYISPIRELISEIKSSKKRWHLRLFHEEMQNLARAIMGDNYFDYLIPIPLDRIKQRQREFNQSELLGRTFARSVGLSLQCRLLYKPHPTASQRGLDRKERLSNLAGAFRVRHTARIKGKAILMVDDVCTTGATAEEAARTLKEHGARRVSLWTLAYVSPEKEGLA